MKDTNILFIKKIISNIEIFHDSSTWFNNDLIEIIIEVTLYFSRERTMNNMQVLRYLVPQPFLLFSLLNRHREESYVFLLLLKISHIYKRFRRYWYKQTNFFQKLFTFHWKFTFCNREVFPILSSVHLKTFDTMLPLRFFIFLRIHYIVCFF